MSAPFTICTRCNKLSSDAETCSTCGTQLRTLASQKLRGWFALGAGAFLAIFMAAIWIWIDRLFAAQGIAARDVSAAQFLGRINVAFALILVAGVLGVINGWSMAHSGRRNLWLLVALLVAFVSALVIAGFASSSYRGS
jgi:ribosomal protein L40E